MNTKTDIIDLSDNLLSPKVYVAKIIARPGELVEFAVQFVGQDEGKPCTWLKTKTVRTAKTHIKKLVKEYQRGKKGE